MSYIPHYIAITNSELESPTGEEILERATFSIEEIEALKIPTVEVIRAGLEIYQARNKS